MERRAIQLGIRGPTLAQYAGPAIVGVEDITPFVAAERSHASHPFERLNTPKEDVFVPCRS